MENEERIEENAFKSSFKYYKSKQPPPNFDNVIDLDCENEHKISKFVLKTACSNLPSGINHPETWCCFKFKAHPGILVVRNPFTVHGQRYWMAKCLRDFTCQPPNQVNLNTQQYPTEVLNNWWYALQLCKDQNELKRMKNSMRWATLGYHHDWDSKVYSEEKRSAFPLDLSKLCEFFAYTLGFHKFVAQAAIVNFYPLGTTLAGHTDHSEKNLEAPLFSFSFGQTAIFLIGGSSTKEQPSALFLRSGDVLVMSKQSRLCYHAVPRVFKAKNENWNACIPEAEENDLETLQNWDMDAELYEKVADELHWLSFKQYIQDARININTRQVLLCGEAHLDDEQNEM